MANLNVEGGAGKCEGDVRDGSWEHGGGGGVDSFGSESGEVKGTGEGEERRAALGDVGPATKYKSLCRRLVTTPSDGGGARMGRRREARLPGMGQVSADSFTCVYSLSFDPSSLPPVTSHACSSSRRPRGPHVQSRPWRRTPECTRRPIPLFIRLQLTFTYSESPMVFRIYGESGLNKVR